MFSGNINKNVFVEKYKGGFPEDYTIEIYYVCSICKKSLWVSHDGRIQCNEQEKNDFVAFHENC